MPLTSAAVKETRGAHPLAYAHPSITETTRFAKMARDQAGLNLKPEKVDFFAQRLASEVRRTATGSYGAYLDWLEARADQDDRRRFIESLTTHTTQFFREPAHFDWLQSSGWDTIVSNASKATVTIWSAACSSGQELYSAMMSAQAWSRTQGRTTRFEGVGTDISHEILRTAGRAVYSGEEIDGIPEAYRHRFLLRAKDRSPRFRIDHDLRDRCQWQHLNLTNMGANGPTRANLIFIRNVLIYFDKQDQEKVINALVDRLEPGGVLLTGHSETLALLPPGLSQVASAIYQRS